MTPKCTIKNEEKIIMSTLSTYVETVEKLTITNILSSHVTQKNSIKMLMYFLIILSVLLRYSHASEGCGNPNEAMYMPFGNTEDGKFVCPVKSDDDKRKLEELSKQNYEMEYCLWEDMLTDRDEKLCQYEVSPVFRRYEDKEHEPIPCSSEEDQFLHYFGYHYCGDEIALEKFRKFDPTKNTSHDIEIRKSKIIVMYNVCFDMINKIPIWTQHSIETPQLFQDSSEVQHYCETNIRKDKFFLEKDFFSYLESRYAWEEKTGKYSGFTAKPHPLVPADHFAIRLGKKATNHYINRAPSWEKLAPLMTAIDEGIKRAAIKASLETPRNGPKEKVLIFTKIETIWSLLTDLKSSFKVEPFERNIWYKFVYDPVKNQGVIIYVHHTRVYKVIKKCKKQIDCNFVAWTRDKKVQRNISEDYLKYAYCCPITTEKASAMFPTKNFNIRENFDIDSMATHYTD